MSSHNAGDDDTKNGTQICTVQYDMSADILEICTVETSYGHVVQIDVCSKMGLTLFIRASSFFSPFGVVRPTQIFGIFKKKVAT